MFIRSYQEKDLEAIAALHHEAIAQGYLTPAAWESLAQGRAAGDREVLLVLERQGQLVGWGRVGGYGDRLGYEFACETSIYVVPTVRGQGAGRRMQRSLLQRAKALGYHHIVAQTLADHLGGLEFYKQLGFKVVGIQKEIFRFQDRWHDVVMLQLLL
ncbi:MAG: N-acetyltransferase [Synechococcales cyanobacterium CRU_2_2]|nr:N-acetyltransferase [Synechococcales cyanobacterium CRU_2_2]